MRSVNGAAERQSLCTGGNKTDYAKNLIGKDRFVLSVVIAPTRINNMNWQTFNQRLEHKRGVLLRQLRSIDRMLLDEDLPISLVDRATLRKQEIDNYFGGIK